MSKHNKNGFHHINLIFAELVFSVFMLSLLAMPILYFCLFVLVVIALVSFKLFKIIRGVYRQIPTMLGYKDLAQEKTKTVIEEAQTANRSLKYSDF